MTIPLHRNVINTVTLPVTIRSDGAWSLTISDRDHGPTRGHLKTTASRGRVLASALIALVAPNAEIALDQPAPALLTRGSGSGIVPVELRQSVAPVDPPGAYSIDLVLEAISGF